MASSDSSPNLDPVEDDIKGMKLKSGNSSDDEDGNTAMAGDSVKQEDGVSAVATPIKDEAASRLATPSKQSPATPSSDRSADDDESVVGGDVIIKQEPGRPPKLERKGSKQVAVAPPALFDHYEDKTDEARSTFEVIHTCTYSSKAIGSSMLGDEENGCDCAEEWDQATGTNHACDEDSDCINRATRMECMGDCGCGADCQNQRFQRRQYANITIIKTEKKGYGVRTDKNLSAGQFIFEYIGEVINEPQFRRRMLQYDEEGIKHFYFMSLSAREFIDATRRGNLGRFCNHSCRPNCNVEKWFVGSKMRMGIFALRPIKAGEELVFDYNVDRYGADPQPCYCGEPNCSGFIGGKTQTDRQTKLAEATLEALGIDDGDGWESSVARRPRKKRAGEDDEEYVDSLQPRSLDEDGVTKVMASLMQNKEKWITVKLLGRIERCEDISVRNRVVRMKGYHIMKAVLNEFKDDDNVVLQVLRILESFPRVTRNKIADAKIEEVISSLTLHEDDRVSDIAQKLLKDWSELEVAYRIPRVKRDPETIKERQRKRKLETEQRERRRRERSRSRSRSPPIDAPKGPSNAPTGPKSGPKAQYNQFSRHFKSRPPPGPLPQGWFVAKNNGQTYYYTAAGQTSWERPTMPAPSSIPKPTPKEDNLDKIIQSIQEEKEREAEAAKAAAATPKPAEKSEKKSRKEKPPFWKDFDEAQMIRQYKTTLSPIIVKVMNQYKNELTRYEYKEHCAFLVNRYAKSDYEKGRVRDPTKISEKGKHTLKEIAKEYVKKLVKKVSIVPKEERERKEKERAEKEEQRRLTKEKARRDRKSGQSNSAAAPESNTVDAITKKEDTDDDIVMELSEDEGVKKEITKSITPATPLEQLSSDSLKRKRQPDVDENGVHESPAESSPNKRPRSITPPPPPPPPPAEDRPASAVQTPTGETPNSTVSNGDGQSAPPAGAGFPQHLPGTQTKLPQRFEEHLPEEDERDYGDDLQTDMSHSV